MSLPWRYWTPGRAPWWRSSAPAAGSELVLTQPVWETPDAVAAVALEGAKTTAMVRLNLDGSVEEIADRGPDFWEHDVYYYFGMDRQSFHGRPI